MSPLFLCGIRELPIEIGNGLCEHRAMCRTRCLLEIGRGARSRECECRAAVAPRRLLHAQLRDEANRAILLVLLRLHGLAFPPARHMLHRSHLSGAMQPRRYADVLEQGDAAIVVISLAGRVKKWAGDLESLNPLFSVLRAFPIVRHDRLRCRLAANSLVVVSGRFESCDTFARGYA